MFDANNRNVCVYKPHIDPLDGIGTRTGSRVRLHYFFASYINHFA